jgi:adenosine deaminase CECR1
MWDSTMTDEFFVAVKEYRLTWEEVKTLSRNSLAHAFADAATKRKLLQDYDDRIGDFEQQMRRGGIAKLGPMPETRRFICAQYQLCNQAIARN